MSSSKPFTAPADGDELPEGKKHSPPLRIPQNQNPIQQESQTSITSRSSELVLGSIDERIFHLQKDEGTPSASFNLAGNRPQQDCPDIVQKDEASATLLPQAEKEDGEEQEELPLLFPQIDEEDERELRHRATSPFQVEKEDKGKKVQEAPLSPQDAPPPTPSLASSEATSKPSSHKTQGTQSEASSAALPQHESPINDKGKGNLPNSLNVKSNNCFHFQKHWSINHMKSENNSTKTTSVRLEKNSTPPVTRFQ